MKTILSILALLCALHARASTIIFQNTNWNLSATYQLTNTIRIAQVPTNSPTVIGNAIESGLPIYLQTTNGLYTNSFAPGTYNLQILNGAGYPFNGTLYFQSFADTNTYYFTNVWLSGGNIFVSYPQGSGNSVTNVGISFTPTNGLNLTTNSGTTFLGLITNYNGTLTFTNATNQFGGSIVDPSGNTIFKDIGGITEIFPPGGSSAAAVTFSPTATVFNAPDNIVALEWLSGTNVFAPNQTATNASSVLTKGIADTLYAAIGSGGAASSNYLTLASGSATITNNLSAASFTGSATNPFTATNDVRAVKLTNAANILGGNGAALTGLQYVSNSNGFGTNTTLYGATDIGTNWLAGANYNGVNGRYSAALNIGQGYFYFRGTNNQINWGPGLNTNDLLYMLVSQNPTQLRSSNTSDAGPVNAQVYSVSNQMFGTFYGYFYGGIDSTVQYPVINGVSNISATANQELWLTSPNHAASGGTICIQTTHPQGYSGMAFKDMNGGEHFALATSAGGTNADPNIFPYAQPYFGMEHVAPYTDATPLYFVAFSHLYGGYNDNPNIGTGAHDWVWYNNNVTTYAAQTNVNEVLRASSQSNLVWMSSADIKTNLTVDGSATVANSVTTSNLTVTAGAVNGYVLYATNGGLAFWGTAPSGGGGTNFNVLSVTNVATIRDVEVTNRVVVQPASLAITGSNVVVDAAFSVYRLTLTTAVFFTNTINQVDGERMTWALQQDATGNRTCAFSTNYNFGTDITGITLTTNAGKIDYLTMFYNGPSNRWDVIGFVRGY